MWFSLPDWYTSLFNFIDSFARRRRVVTQGNFLFTHSEMK